MDLGRLPVEQIPCDRVPELLRRARASLPGPGSPALRRAVALSEVSEAYLAMYRCTGEHRDRENAVAFAREAVALVPEGRPERRRADGNLGTCLSYHRTVVAQDEAIALWRGVLDGLRAGSREHAAALGESGLAFLTLYELRGLPEDLERAVDHLDRALAGPRLEEAVRATLTMGLALALVERCRRISTDPADARRAVDLLEELEAAGTAAAIVGFRDALRINLEAARQELFRVGSDPGALDTTPDPGTGPHAPRPLPGLDAPGHTDQLSAVRSAVSAAVTGRLHETDRAIRLADRALDGVAPGDPSRAPLLCDAAHHRLARAQRRRRTDPAAAGQDVAAAVQLAREAVRVALGVHVPGAAVQLATGLLHRYTETTPRAPRDLDEAVTLLERVLRSPDRRPDILPAARDRYADALLLRAARDHRAEDFAKALELRTTAVRRLAGGTAQRALASAALAQVLLVRAGATGLSDHGAEATSCSRQAVRALEQVMPGAALDAARRWADWAWAGRRLRDAGEAYDAMLALLHRVTVTQVTREDKETVLADASTVGRRAAYAHAVAGDPRRAAVAVEGGRAVILAEALDRERFALDTLRAAAPALADRYEQALLRLEQATNALVPAAV